MTNQQLIDEIVSDLLSLEPGFTEEQVRPLVAKFLASRPAIEPTAEFREELYQTLLREIQRQPEKLTINSSNMFNKFKFTFAAVAMVAVFVVITTVMPKGEEVTLSSRQEINQLASNAFGSLTSLNTANVGGTGNRTQSGGGGGNLASALEGAVPAPAAVSEDAKMVAGMGGGSSLSFVPPVSYSFKYAGDEFTVEDSEMSVYQRQKGFGGASLGSFLDKFNVGLFNIDKFANATLDYITASQNIDFGYTLSLDTKQGYVSIFENWEKWQTPDRMCTDEACYNQYRLRADQVPADDAVIATASAFLDEYGINRDNYGQPVVQNQWRIMYDAAADKSQVYIPDTVGVVYPSKIGDNEVYDQNGNKSGMYVMVNVRLNKVSNVSELTGQRFDGSNYATETDTTRLIGVAEKGGFQQYVPYAAETGVQTKTLNLGTPTTGFVRMWQYEGNQSREMYVPSLIFPVQDAPADLYFQYITVPLIKSVLDSQPNMGVPMPLMERAQ